MQDKEFRGNQWRNEHTPRKLNVHYLALKTRHLTLSLDEFSFHLHTIFLYLKSTLILSPISSSGSA
jgi:hypothetical protein